MGFSCLATSAVEKSAARTVLVQHEKENWRSADQLDGKHRATQVATGELGGG